MAAAFDRDQLLAAFDRIGRAAREHGTRSPDWFNDAIGFHLSPLADRAAAHVEFGTFPRDAEPVGLVVHVPSADYMLALKLKASRVADATKGDQELQDIANLIRAAGVRSIDDAIEIFARYFPKSAADAGKQRFVLRQIWPEEEKGDAPQYPVRGR